MAAGPTLERTTFRTSRLLEFCSRKELVAQTGHQPEAWPLVALKEVVDRLITGVNWSPGIVNPFRALGPYHQSLDTVLSQQRADRDEPVIVLLHLACPRVEYTDRGKSAVVVAR